MDKSILDKIIEKAQMKNSITIKLNGGCTEVLKMRQFMTEEFYHDGEYSIELYLLDEEGRKLRFIEKWSGATKKEAKASAVKYIEDVINSEMALLRFLRGQLQEVKRA